MSRYQIETQPFTVIVGWDNPLQTLFAQVWDPKLKDDDDDDGGCIFWVGTHPGSIRTVSDLAQVISGYAILPRDIMSQLEQDQRRSKPPTPLQQWVGARLGPESICDEQAHEHHCYQCRTTTHPRCCCEYPDDLRRCEDWALVQSDGDIYPLLK